MFGKKIKLNDTLYDKVKLASEMQGCSSIEEYVEKVLQKDVDMVLGDAASNVDISQQEVDDIANKLKGLGYLE